MSYDTCTSSFLPAHPATVFDLHPRLGENREKLWSQICRAWTRVQAAAAWKNAGLVVLALGGECEAQSTDEGYQLASSSVAA